MFLWFLGDPRYVKSKTGDIFSVTDLFAIGTASILAEEATDMTGKKWLTEKGNINQESNTWKHRAKTKCTCERKYVILFEGEYLFSNFCSLHLSKVWFHFLFFLFCFHHQFQNCLRVQLQLTVHTKFMQIRGHFLRLFTDSLQKMSEASWEVYLLIASRFPFTKTPYQLWVPHALEGQKHHYPLNWPIYNGP